MRTLRDLINASYFFAGFLPSFTSLGYLSRRSFWTHDRMDFSAQRWLVTGASAGIGHEIALQAAAHGARVIAVARSADKLAMLADAAERLPGSIVPLTLDLSLVRETRALVDQLRRDSPVDVLVNNVGVLLNEPATTIEGLDTGFATNLLNPWLLTELAKDRDLLNETATVINMSSGGMYNVPLSVEALESHASYQGALAYAYHKRAQVVLTGLQRSAETAQRQHYVMHPGWVDTPGVETSLPDFHRLLKPLLRNVAAGADTALWLAAERPQQARPEGIWFDRALRPAHLLPGTRRGAEPQSLLAYLKARAEAAEQQAAAAAGGSTRSAA